jgi:hypothetical protein
MSNQANFEDLLNAAGALVHEIDMSNETRKPLERLRSLIGRIERGEDTDRETYFVQRTEPFADGSGPGVNVYVYDTTLGMHVLAGCLEYHVAANIHGGRVILDSLPETVKQDRLHRLSR